MVTNYLVSMTGFKDEKELWQFQKPRLIGKWDRYELMTPPGHPDVKGSYRRQIIYIENKVGLPSLKAFEQSQLEYFKWLIECSQTVYTCFGSKDSKTTTWRYMFNSGGALDMEPTGPHPWWRGDDFVVSRRSK